MSFEVAYTTAEGDKIRDLLKQNPDIQHLLPEIQFIGNKTNDYEALKFLQEHIAYHIKHTK